MITTPSCTRPAGGPCPGPTYSVPRGLGRGVPRVLPPGGVRHLPTPVGRVDHRAGTTHHQRGVAGHRTGRQGALGSGLCSVRLGVVGLGRPEQDPGSVDRRPVDPDRCHLDRGGRYPPCSCSASRSPPDAARGRNYPTASHCRCRRGARVMVAVGLFWRTRFPFAYRNRLGCFTIRSCRLPIAV